MAGVAVPRTDQVSAYRSASGVTVACTLAPGRLVSATRVNAPSRQVCSVTRVARCQLPATVNRSEPAWSAVVASTVRPARAVVSRSWSVAMSRV